MRPYFLSIFLLAVTGCGPMARTVVMKINDQQAHIYMNEGEVKVGDKVGLFGQVCQPTSGTKQTQGKGCVTVKKGEGIVTEILNNRYSAIRVTEGSFEKGTFVEKLKDNS